MDVATYNSCVHNYSDSLYRFACKCTGNTEDGRDVVQGCFEVLWQKRHSVTADKVKTFRFQVACNQSAIGEIGSKVSFACTLPTR